MTLHVCVTNILWMVYFLCPVCDSICLSLRSLHSFVLPSCRSCEHVIASPPSHQHHVSIGGQTAATTTTAHMTTSSLGLLKLLQKHGISASPYPHNHSAKPSSTEKDKDGGSSSGKEGARRNIFSLNLVGKLQSLGLHRVAAWGMMGRSGRERETNNIRRKSDGS